MSDRAIELAAALASDPWVPPHVRQACSRLLEKWEGEDLQIAENSARTKETIMAGFDLAIASLKSA